MKPLTLLQRQRITLSLFFTVAVGAVFTVATPAFVPWKVVDDKRAQALDQQRRQNKDFHVIENRGRSRSGSPGGEDQDSVSTSSHPTSSSISHQGPLVSLLTDRTQHQPLTEDGIRTTDTEQAGTEPTTKKRRRRRRRKMVNEGWQEFTGRTAREEKEKEEKDKQQKDTPQSTKITSTSDPEPLGENGGREISWKNKAQ
ncbi:hypothetical protein EC991_008689 [Linnemannia zychae]|nr:hypothetical protein EC991_008689 [Linnemannia zychae]